MKIFWLKRKLKKLKILKKFQRLISKKHAVTLKGKKVLLEKNAEARQQKMEESWEINEKGAFVEI